MARQRIRHFGAAGALCPRANGKEAANDEQETRARAWR